MPSTTAAKTGRSGVNSIEDAFGAFLNDLRAELPASAVKCHALARLLANAPILVFLSSGGHAP